MERLFSVNEIFKDTITKIDHKLLPAGFEDLPKTRIIQQQISKLIDCLGHESAKAQNLSRVITSGDKLRSSSHFIYLLKDANANGGTGEVIGLLKLGKKDLYLLCPNGELQKSTPMCVLDFYVSRDYQRRGLGKKLFDYMLADINMQAFQFAIDYPSDKMERFLNRNYGLKSLIRQNNNFAVPEEFFGAQHVDSEPIIPHSVGRSSQKPTSQVALIIHGTVEDDQSNLLFHPVTPTVNKTEFETLPVTEMIHMPITGSWMGDTVGNPLSAKEQLGIQEKGNVEKNPKSPRTLKVGRSTSTKVPKKPDRGVMPAGISTARRDSQVTERGNIDIKYHHSKLW